MLAGILNKIPYHRVTNALRKYLGPLVSRSEYYENDLGTRHLLNDLNNCKEQPLEETLLQKASIVTTPTAYDNGSLHSVKPVQSFGSELVTNGDFATDSDWNKTTGWTISNGRANRSGVSSNTYISQDFNIEQGKKYIVKYDRTYISGNGETNLYSYFDSNTTRTTKGIYNSTVQETVTVTDTFVAGHTGGLFLRVYGISNFTGSIDNVSIKEVTEADFSFTRGSAATRVNENFLVKNVQILSDDLVQNGDFSQIGSEEITNGDFSQIGSELVTNGDFATDTDWSKGTGCTIQNGKAKYTNAPSGQGFTQSNFLTIGKFYKITFTVSDYSQGSVKIRYPFNMSNTITANGTYTEYGEAVADDLFLQNVGTTTLSIENVSVKEVGQDWTFSSGASMGNDIATIIGDGTSFTNISQSNVFTVGKLYKVTLDAVINSGLGLKVQDGSTNENFGAITTSGTYTFYGKANNSTLTIGRRTGGTAFDSYVDNISVKEVGQNWNFVGGTNMTDNGVSFIDDGTNIFSYVQQLGILTSGRKYRVSFDVR
jgi:hypothetical protein